MKVQTTGVVPLPSTKADNVIENDKQDPPLHAPDTPGL